MSSIDQKIRNEQNRREGEARGQSVEERVWNWIWDTFSSIAEGQDYSLSAAERRVGQLGAGIGAIPGAVGAASDVAGTAAEAGVEGAGRAVGEAVVWLFTDDPIPLSEIKRVVLPLVNVPADVKAKAKRAGTAEQFETILSESGYNGDAIADVFLDGVAAETTLIDQSGSVVKEAYAETRGSASAFAQGYARGGTNFRKKPTATAQWWRENQNATNELAVQADTVGGGAGAPPLEEPSGRSIRYDPKSDKIIVLSDAGSFAVSAQFDAAGEPYVTVNGRKIQPVDDRGNAQEIRGLFLEVPEAPGGRPMFGPAGWSPDTIYDRAADGTPGFDISEEGRNGYPNIPKATDLPGRVVDGKWVPYAITAEEAKPFRFDVQRIRPSYYHGDNTEPFKRMDPDDIVRIEDLLVQAGILEDWQVGGGAWSFAHSDAMGYVMERATERGITWDEALEILAKNPIKDPDAKTSTRSGFVPDPYLAPDYATLAQQVKSVFRQRLGREPTNSEILILADQMASDSRQSYDVQVAAARSQFEAGNKAFDTGEEQPSPGQFQDVDYVARLLQKFDTDYKPEQDLIAQRDEIKDRTSLFMQQLSTMAGTI